MKAKKADILVDQLRYLLFALFEVGFNNELEVKITSWCPVQIIQCIL